MAENNHKEILTYAHLLQKRFNICETNFSRIRIKIINKEFTTLEDLEKEMLKLKRK